MSIFELLSILCQDKISALRNVSDLREGNAFYRINVTFPCL